MGSIITFGSYEQDNDPANGPEPLEWIVVEDEGDAVLLISAYGIDVKPYNDVQADIEWEDCSLRTWLNNDFLNIAFDQGGAEMLKREELYNNDKVFLLLMTGYIFNSDIIGGACKMTPYAISQSAAQNSDDRSAWWLSNADFLGTGYRVDLNGETEFCLMTDLTAVRPSIILKKF